PGACGKGGRDKVAGLGQRDLAVDLGTANTLVFERGRGIIVSEPSVVAADFEVTEQMLRYFLRKAHRSRWARQRVVMCVPSGVTDVETRAVEEACLSA